MEDDSDAEMADYGTDFSDDVDRNFDAKARPQQGPTVEIRSRRSFAGVKLRLYLKLNLTLEVFVEYGPDGTSVFIVPGETQEAWNTEISVRGA